MGLAAIAVITSRGRAVPGILKAEVAAEKGVLYQTIKLTTTSKSLAPSRTDTIYDSKDQILKFGVTDANLVRYNKSLKEAGPGAYRKFSDVLIQGKELDSNRLIDKYDKKDRQNIILVQ